jgi:hypothetical protein
MISVSAETVKYQTREAALSLLVISLFSKKKLFYRICSRTNSSNKLGGTEKEAIFEWKIQTDFSSWFKTVFQSISTFLILRVNDVLFQVIPVNP